MGGDAWAEAAFRRCGRPQLVVDGGGRVLALNDAARDLVGEPSFAFEFMAPRLLPGRSVSPSAVEQGADGIATRVRDRSGVERSLRIRFETLDLQGERGWLVELVSPRAGEGAESRERGRRALVGRPTDRVAHAFREVLQTLELEAPDSSSARLRDAVGLGARLLDALRVLDATPEGTTRAVVGPTLRRALEAARALDLAGHVDLEPTAASMAVRMPAAALEQVVLCLLLVGGSSLSDRLVARAEGLDQVELRLRRAGGGPVPEASLEGLRALVREHGGIVDRDDRGDVRIRLPGAAGRAVAPAEPDILQPRVHEAS